VGDGQATDNRPAGQMASRRKSLRPADFQRWVRRGRQHGKIRGGSGLLTVADPEPCRKQDGDCGGSKGRCQAGAAFHVNR
jgi:hypothetical protein